VVCDWSGSDERDVRDGRVGCEVVGDVGPAYNGLYDVWGVAACFESTGCDRCEVGRRPSRGF
jgi:hypothetical protein